VSRPAAVKVVPPRTDRQLRRALGSEAAEIVGFQEQRLRFALNILRRGFFGRVKWLLFGR
jgi:hypothetical protein